MICLVASTQYLVQTDRRTDTQTDTAGKKEIIIIIIITDLYSAFRSEDTEAK